jgi:hypothetical protein
VDVTIPVAFTSGKLIVFFGSESWAFVGFVVMFWNWIFFGSVSSRPFVFGLHIFAMQFMAHMKIVEIIATFNYVSVFIAIRTLQRPPSVEVVLVIPITRGFRCH